ncbi:hypothetical protein [Saccharopolyspora cebuensis]|uniref:Uncharacterized protein n=1 Tax=Saccharopolyspora cebuensis TaxID=418759 RepID=A0ABV4CMK3_9PSEU
MTEEISHFALRTVVPDPSAAGAVVQVRPMVDGVDVVAVDCPEERAAGPDELLRPDGPLVATAGPHEVRLAEAECTEQCCGALYVTIRRDGEHVVWSGWDPPAIRENSLPEFRFDARQYQAELDRAWSDRSWEWPAATVARLLEQDLHRQVEWLERWDCSSPSVRAYPWERDRITLYFMHPRQGDLRDPRLQFRIVLRVFEADPAAQAERIAGLLLASDPREVGEVCGGS